LGFPLEQSDSLKAVLGKVVEDCAAVLDTVVENYTFVLAPVIQHADVLYPGDPGHVVDCSARVDTRRSPIKTEYEDW